MNAQQLHDYIIKPTLKYMGESYNTEEARFLLLCTAAIESDCGHFIKQVNGPALGIWQMEPRTHNDTWDNCDILHECQFGMRIASLGLRKNSDDRDSDYTQDLTASPKYACAMARLKYSMDPHALPKYNGGTALDLDMFYRYYKRVYNTHLGASTFQKWLAKIEEHQILKVQL